MTTRSIFLMFIGALCLGLLISCGERPAAEAGPSQAGETGAHAHEGEAAAPAETEPGHTLEGEAEHTHEGEQAEETPTSPAGEDHEHRHVTVPADKQKAWGIAVGHVHREPLTARVVLTGILALNQNRTAHVSGRQGLHYGLTDHKEYFAEMTETFFVGNDYFPFNHYQLHREHPPSYALLARAWGAKIKPPKADDSRPPSILDLRILATLKSQRGEFDEALALVARAEERNSDAEGRLASLRKVIEKQRDEAVGERQ